MPSELDVPAFRNGKEDGSRLVIEDFGEGVILEVDHPSCNSDYKG